MGKYIRIRRPDDFHIHFRRGNLLKMVVPHTARYFGRALVMPNTKPKHIGTGEQALEYRKEIFSALNGFDFIPLMTIQVTHEMTPEMVRIASQCGVVAGKIYPMGVTTNSENGVTDFNALYPVYREMEKIGMVLSLHGESPSCNVEGLRKEQNFLPILQIIAHDFPKLRIVLEHITTEEAVSVVASLDQNVSATVTVHHLFLELDDVIGYSRRTKGYMQPHHFCKPIAKHRRDRQALIDAVTSGNPKFFYGGDSAPHTESYKEAKDVCAGIFNAPVALPLLAQLFEEQECLEKLDPFVSRFGADFYQIPYNREHIKLVEKEWEVPPIYGEVVPFMAGEKLRWKVV